MARASEVTPTELEQERWVRLATGELTVLSDASAGKAQQWAREIELFRRGLREALPLPDYKWEPATILMFDSERSLRRFLPMQDGKAQMIQGYTATLAGRHVIAVSLDWPRARTREIIYHEVVHWYLHGANAPLPMWFDEGLAGVFQTAALVGENFRAGDLQADFRRLIKISKLAPYSQVIVQRELDYSRASWRHGRTDLFYAQAWALAHWELFGLPGGGSVRMLAYVDALKRGLEGEAAIRAGFGESIAEAEAHVLRHIRQNVSYQPIVRPLDRNLPHTALAVAPADRFELLENVGLLLSVAGRAETAGAFCRRACDLKPTNLWAWELSAYRAVVADDAGEAERALRRAKELGCNDARLYCAIGHAYLARAVRLNSTGKGYAASAPAVEASVFFCAACKLQPDFRGAYEGLASASFLDNAITEDDRRWLREGDAHYPHSVVVQMAMAVEEVRENNRAAAGQRLRRVLHEGVFRDESERKLLETMLATVQT